MNSSTDKEIMSSHDEEDLQDMMFQSNYSNGDWYLNTKHSCKGCDEHKNDVQERSDAYGIFTGYYCEHCYDKNYPYRKDKYPTIENDGYGERLEDY